MSYEIKIAEAYSELIDASILAGIYVNMHIKLAKHPSSNDIFIIEFRCVETNKTMEILKPIKDKLIKELPIWKIKNYIVDEIWRKNDCNFYSYMGDIYNKLK